MASNDSQQSGKRSLADREGDQPPEGEADNEAEVDSKKEREELAESLAKRPRLNDSSSSDDEDEDDSRDPGKTEYKELSKALRALHTLTSDPEEDQDEEKEQRLREMAGKLQELCNQEVGEGEVPNALKIIQIHLKYTLMHSEKIADEENVKNFLSGLEDGSASKSDDDDTVFVFVANYATELWYQWNEEELQWYWTPDREHWMPCSSDVVLGGQWEGETPAPENVEIITYLDAIRPIPSNEQYLPSLEFDVLSILQSLAGSSDDGLRGNVGDVVSVLSAQGKEMKSRSRHLEGWKKGLQDIVALVEK